MANMEKAPQIVVRAGGARRVQLTPETARAELEYLIRFTEAYRSEADKYIREAKCLRLQMEKLLLPLGEEDMIAGRVRSALVGFSPQYGGLYTYYFHETEAVSAFGLARPSMTDMKFKWQAQKAIEFWKEERTVSKLRRAFARRHGDIETEYRPFAPYIGMDDDAGPGVGSYPTARIALPIGDMDKLLRLGVPGMRAEIERCRQKNGGSTFYRALDMTVDNLVFSLELYRRQAAALAESTSGETAGNMERLERALRSLQEHPPRHFLEALQLYWIYCVASDQINTGRMDVFLGDFYVRDLDAGLLTEEDAIRYLSSLYRHFIFHGKVHDTRVIIGGLGRRNPENADRLAMAILETSRRVRDLMPQLTVRYHRGISDSLWNKALQVLGEGGSFPLLYSDETNVPAVMKLFGVSREEAEKYIPAGCGEYVLEGCCIGSPNCAFNLAKAVELVLHDGDDRYFGVQCGPRVGPLESLDTFEKLWDAYRAQVEHELLLEAWAQAECYMVAGENAGYLQLSLVMDDCLERGKSLLEGGVRYLNGVPEIVGSITAADSLTAMKKLVYEEKKFTLTQLRDMLDADFEGFERERRMLLDAPKYGNNHAEADLMAVRVYEHIAKAAVKNAREVGLDNYNIVCVNNSASAEWGAYTEATPCGRHRGAPLSNAHGASIGADKAGITSLLHSMRKFDASLHAGVINSVRITKELFSSSYDKVKALVTTFFENNGTQLNLMIIGREDLVNAMKEPEKYRNLIVRIGGFSARFVELNPVVQNEILLRTTYES